jgi:hypothetical protein
LTVEETVDTSAVPSGTGAGRARTLSAGRVATPFLALFASLLLALALTGCGGTPQDKDAPTGTWQASVTEWKFPKEQALGTPVEFVLKIRNDDTRTIPQLVVTIRGLKTRVQQPDAGSKIRPIWLPDEVNYADVTPYNAALASTYNLGSLAAGAIKTYRLPLTPLRRGEHEVGYTLAAGLYGGAKIESEDGDPVAASRIVAIDPTPQFDQKFFDED